MDLSPEIIESREVLAEFLNSQEPGVRTVKPRVVFRTVEEHLGIPITMSLKIPSSEIGSITMLEAAILCALLRLTLPDSVLEIGTYLGYSTRLFLDNTGASCKVTSIDLPATFEVNPNAASYSELDLHLDDIKNDEYLRLKQRVVGTPYISDIDHLDAERLQLVKADSRLLIPSQVAAPRSVDFVFIDGGHDEDTVASDSNLASELVGVNGVIVWHDFGSTIHHDVAAEIHAIAATRQIISVANTLLAIELRGDIKAVFQNSK